MKRNDDRNGFRWTALGLLLALAASPGCGDDTAADDADDADGGPTHRCGLFDPHTGEAWYCSYAGNEVCVCDTNRCAKLDLECETNYRYTEGMGECVAVDDMTEVIVSESGTDYCSAAEADGDADGDGDVEAETGGDADVEARDADGLDGDVPIPPGCGNGVVEAGEQCDGDPPMDCTTSCGTPGEQACVDCAWGECTLEETCNGYDDDCDTTCDDGFECCARAIDSCATTCGSASTRTCSESCSWLECVLPEETCNGGDDDCDTFCDEDSECCAGTSEPCDTTCFTTGTRSCSGTCSWQPCVPPAEICNGVDDDCDTTCDEGYDCCARAEIDCLTTCGTAGSKVCTGSCTAPEECTPPADICNGVDDDCDTTCDQGSECCASTSESCLTTCATTGTRTCSASCLWQACDPPLETCNGIDDDCDTLTDEVGAGFACGDGCCNGGETYCGCPSDCTTAVPPPSTPALLGPWNGTLTGTHLVPANLRPRFTWAPPTGGCGTATFDFQVDDSCTTPGFDLCAFPSPVSATGVSATEWMPTSGLAVYTSLPVGRRYYWRVRACDGAAGCSTWSAVRYLDVGRVASDFNGDGRSDLAIGVPWGGNPATTGDSGYVVAYLGAASGIDFGTYESRFDSEPTENEGFGTALAVADFNADGYADLAVGVPGYHGTVDDAGAVFVYRGSSSGLGTVPVIRNNPDNQTGSRFGDALATADVDGDGFADLAVGSPQYDYFATADVGKAYLFFGNSALELPTGSQIRGTSSEANSRFGSSLSMAGDLLGDGHAGLLVGAPYANLGSTADVGLVFVYQGTDSGLLGTDWAALADPEGQAGARFGSYVACIGDGDGNGRPEFAVAAPLHDAGATNEGNVFVYSIADRPPTATPALTIDNPANETDGRMGALAATGSLSSAGSIGLVVGALWQSAPEMQEGNAFVFSGSTALPTSPTATLDNPEDQAGGWFGATVASRLDLDGNGFNDVVIGAPMQDGSATNQGRVFVFLAPSGGGSFPTSPSQTIEGLPWANEGFGAALATGY